VLDAIESFAIHDQVFDDRERLRAERLDDDGVAVLEAAHVGLAGRHAFVRAVGFAADHQRARAADAFATIVVERNRVFAFVGEFLVHHVEHFEERHVLV
jgi:hypothetical protein